MIVFFAAFLGAFFGSGGRVRVPPEVDSVLTMLFVLCVGFGFVLVVADVVVAVVGEEAK